MRRLITIDTNASEYISEIPSLKIKRKSSFLNDFKAKHIERVQWMQMQREKHLLEMQILNFKKNENILKNFDKILATSLKGSYAGNWIVIVGPPTYSSYIEAENIKTIVVRSITC